MVELVKDEVYRRRIARSLFNLCPTESQGAMRLQFGEEKEFSLKPEYRPRFETVMKIPETGDHAIISGPIVKVDLGEK